MRKLVGIAAAVVAAALLCAGASVAQDRVLFPGSAIPVVTMLAGTPLGFAQIELSTNAASLNPPSTATFAIFSVTGASATWRDDGVPPTPTIGFPILVGSPPIALSNLATLQFVASGDAVLNVAYYK
jgi:hypothetical protein